MPAFRSNAPDGLARRVVHVVERLYWPALDGSEQRLLQVSLPTSLPMSGV